MSKSKYKAPRVNPTGDEIPEEVEEQEEDVVEGLSAESEPASTLPKKSKEQEAAEEAAAQASVAKMVKQMGKQTAAALAKHPTEKIKIPMDKLNPEDDEVWVGINGWNYRIKKEVAVELPVPIVDLLIMGGYNPTRVR